MTDSAADGYGLTHVPSGVLGLDQVLRGGFFSGGVYIIRGAPGAGKTILANQICFRHAEAGGRALYVTLLSESHARMMQHMERLSFYNPDTIPSRLYFVSGFNALEEDGLRGLMTLLRREVRNHRASLLVLDGLLAVEESSGSDREFRKFIHEFQAYASAENCIALLLTNGSRRDYHPEHTMVDGLITLEDVRFGKRAQRELEVRKFRGSGSLRGRHPFRISDQGVTVYPRVETVYGLLGPEEEDHVGDARVSTGAPELDRLLGGGLQQGTTTLLLGASGSGKTTLGTQFLAQASAEHPALHFGFYETPMRLMANARTLELPLERLHAEGALHILWRSPTEQMLDDLGHLLIETVEQRGIKRLFVDGIGGFMEAADLPSRVPSVFSALSNELRKRDVTTLYTAETSNLVGPSVFSPLDGLSAIADGLVLLRYVEAGAHLHRLLSVLKMRGGSFDAAVREFTIGKGGVDVFTDGETAAALLGLGTVQTGTPFGQVRATPRPDSAPTTLPDGG